MNFRAINHTIGSIILLEMAFMLPSLVWCWVDRDGHSAVAFGVALLLVLALAWGAVKDKMASR